MKVYRTKGGYFYKELKNGKKSRISKEQYEKQRKKQKRRKLVGGETNREIQKNLKGLIYKAIYGKGKHGIFGSARKNITNIAVIQNAKRQLINYYNNNKFLFNRTVNSHKSNGWFDKKTSNNRFRGKTYIQVIEDAAKNSTNSASQQRAKALIQEFEKIDERKRNIIKSEKKKQENLKRHGNKCSRCSGSGRIVTGYETYNYNPGSSAGGGDYEVKEEIYGNCYSCNGIGYVPSKITITPYKTQIRNNTNRKKRFVTRRNGHNIFAQDMFGNKRKYDIRSLLHKNDNTYEGLSIK